MFIRKFCVVVTSKLIYNTTKYILCEKIEDVLEDVVVNVTVNSELVF